MHKSGRTVPSARGLASKLAIRRSLLKLALACQRYGHKYFVVLADPLKKSLHCIQPAAGSWTVLFAPAGHQLVEFM